MKAEATLKTQQQEMSRKQGQKDPQQQQAASHSSRNL
jgi:hypothetical protein